MNINKGSYQLDSFFGEKVQILQEFFIDVRNESIYVKDIREFLG